MTGEPRRRYAWVFGVAAVVLVVDQVTKAWAEAALGDGRRIGLAGDLLGLRLLYNPGAAFSIGSGATWLFTVVSGVAVVALAWYARRISSTAWAIALGLLLGGATTHFGDRLLRAPGFGRGHVVDFIDYAGLFVGNVADIALFCGVALALVLSLRGDREPTPSSEPD
ncbi:signal peptidase II [Geodermatophilus sp. SYSU D00697]